MSTSAIVPSPLVTVRQIGGGTFYVVNTITESVITTLGVSIGLLVEEIANIVAGQNLTIDLPPNQEVVTVLSVSTLSPAFFAVFTKQHTAVGIPVTYQISSGYEPLYGAGQADFLTNLAAVAQIIATRLRLFQGEWWASQTDGLPLWQSILAQPASQKSQQQIATLITARILGTPYVTGIGNVQTSFSPITRAFGYTAQVQTQFGPVTVSNIPVPPSQALPS
jgi:hypothetical protein